MTKIHKKNKHNTSTTRTARYLLIANKSVNEINELLVNFSFLQFYSWNVFFRDIILLTWQFREYVSTADEFVSDFFLFRKKKKKKFKIYFK